MEVPSTCELEAQSFTERCAEGEIEVGSGSWHVLGIARGEILPSPWSLPGFASRVSVSAGRQPRQMDRTCAEEAAVHKQQAVKAAVGWLGGADHPYGVVSLGKGSVFGQP